MAELFSHLTFWHWLGLGLLLLSLEVTVSGGGFLLWIGLAAFLTAVVAGIFPTLFWGVQVLLFAVSSVAFAAGWSLYLRRSPTASDRPVLNRRGEQYVGRIFTLQSAIDNGRGSIRVDDSIWRVAGDDLPVGTQVKVVATEGVILRVEKAE